MNTQDIESKALELFRLHRELRKRLSIDKDTLIRDLGRTLESGSEPLPANSASFWNDFAKCQDLEVELRSFLADPQSVKVNDKAAHRILTRLIGMKVDDSVLDELIQVVCEDDLDELQIKLFNVDDQIKIAFANRHKSREYFRRLFEILLVTHSDLSVTLKQFLRELKEAYALGLPNSVSSLCRTCLERTAVEVGMNIGCVPSDYYRKKRYFEEYPPKTVFRLVTQGRNDLFNKAYWKLYRHFCTTVHGELVAKGDLRKQIVDTIKTIGQIYNHNASRMKVPK